jgi:hypothetical protein
MLLTAVGGPVEVIRGLMVFFICFMLRIFHSNDDLDIVACPDKLTWGVRYVSCTAIIVNLISLSSFDDGPSPYSKRRIIF